MVILLRFGRRSVGSRHVLTKSSDCDLMTSRDVILVCGRTVGSKVGVNDDLER
jgi:hypothetical protein